MVALDIYALIHGRKYIAPFLYLIDFSNTDFLND